jgi:hypothetical protein
MIIIGVDFHPEYQEIASVNTDTGEYQEKRLARKSQWCAVEHRVIDWASRSPFWWEFEVDFALVEKQFAGANQGSLVINSRQIVDPTHASLPSQLRS